MQYDLCTRCHNIPNIATMIIIIIVLQTIFYHTLSIYTRFSIDGQRSMMGTMCIRRWRSLEIQIFEADNISIICRRLLSDLISLILPVDSRPYISGGRYIDDNKCFRKKVYKHVTGGREGSEYIQGVPFNISKCLYHF